MARVNITVPDSIITQSRSAGLNVSRIATAALVDELDRRDKIAALDAYLGQLEREFGPITIDEQAAAASWVEQLLTPVSAPLGARREERMTLVLDSGGITALAGQRARLAELRRRDLWPPQVPTVVLTEALTGDHRRDFHENQLLKLCQLRDVTEQLARSAAQLRTETGRAATISATDAIVGAFALTLTNAIILTSDPEDLRH